MARAGIVKEVNSFIKGLITEANPIAFPENASLVDENFNLNIDGSRQRRFGLSFENDAYITETDYTNSSASNLATSIHLWTNVAKDPSLKIVVVQFGQYLYFFDGNQEPISNAPLNDSNALLLSDIEEDFVIQTANMSGSFIITTGTKYINILDYDVTTDEVTQSARNIKIRDLFGVDDSLEVETRPSTLTDEHEYNLLNQGWDSDKISTFFSTKGSYPSNADVWWLFKDTDGNFDPNEADKIELGNTPAAKGHFIIDPFDRGTQRDTVSSGGSGNSTGGGSTREPFNPNIRPE